MEYGWLKGLRMGQGSSDVVVRWSGEVQVRVKFHKYSELDIGFEVDETFYSNKYKLFT